MMRTLAIYAIVVCAVANLCGCSWSKVSVTKGSFDVYAPAPYTGATFSMDEKSDIKRASVQVRKNDKETLKLHKLTNKEADTGGGGYRLEKAMRISHTGFCAFRLREHSTTSARTRFPCGDSDSGSTPIPLFALLPDSTRDLSKRA